MRVVAGTCGRVGDLHPFEHLDRDLPRLGLAEVAVRPDLLGDLVPDGIGRVQARHRFLEDHGDVVTADLTEVSRGEAHEVTSLEEGRPAGPAAPGGQQSHHGQGRNRLARAALTDQPEGLAPSHREGGVFHHREPLAVREEFDAEVLDRSSEPSGSGRHRRRWPMAGPRPADAPQPGQAGPPLLVPPLTRGSSSWAVPGPGSRAARRPPG